jgi:hypothetical protein
VIPIVGVINKTIPLINLVYLLPFSKKFYL